MNFFISEYYIKTATTISQNVDIKDVVPLIAPASDFFIAKILTQNYYDYLLSAYTAQSLTEQEEVLVSKIKPALAWRAAAMAEPFLWAQTKNKGSQVQSGEFSTPISREEMSYKISLLNTYASGYQQKLIEELECHWQLYPPFSGLCAEYSNKNQYDSGIAMYNNWDYYYHPIYRKLKYYRG